MLKIYTFAQHRPDFIALQLESFQRFIKDEFEFIVFNAATFGASWISKDQNQKNYEDINAACATLGVQVIDVLRDDDLVHRCRMIAGDEVFRGEHYATANEACSYPLCWAWEKYIANQTGPVCLMHSDVFFTAPFKPSDYDFLFTIDGRQGVDEVICYMWEVFFYADLAKLSAPNTINWWCGKINGTPVDVGGQTYHYLKTHPDLKYTPISMRFIPEGNYHEGFVSGGEPFLLHYRSGSNWDQQKQEYHQQKTEWLKGRLRG